MRVAPLAPARPRDEGGVGVVAGDEGNVPEANRPVHRDGRAAVVGAEGDGDTVERLAAEPVWPPEAHFARPRRRLDRGVGGAGGEGERERTGRAPLCREAQRAAQGRRRLEVDNHHHAEAGVPALLEPRRRVVAAVEDLGHSVHDRRTQGRQGGKVDRLPDPLGHGVRAVEVRVRVRRPVPAAGARGEAAVDVNGRVEADRQRVRVRRSHREVRDVERVPQELVYSDAETSAVELDRGAHLDSVEDEEEARAGPAELRAGGELRGAERRGVRPRVVVPQRRVEPVLLVERVANHAGALQVGEQVARHGGVDLEGERRAVGPLRLAPRPRLVNLGRQHRCGAALRRGLQQAERHTGVVERRDAERLGPAVLAARFARLHALDSAAREHHR
mmetsp:Transcript_33478/g.111699  ORF Transcript_33478/g.111699 Transcript_33478/m.111699 type:complete len:389 (-) Transcript_33478:218-1384(-)